MTQHPQQAIVAGAGPGLGEALCRRLTQAGYRVTALARSAEANRALADELGPDRFQPICCDVTDVTDLDAAIGQVEARWGPAGVYIHNAAPFQMGAFDMAPEQCLDPGALADTCVHLIGQDRSAWTWELDIRPDVEGF